MSFVVEELELSRSTGLGDVLLVLSLRRGFGALFLWYWSLRGRGDCGVFVVGCGTTRWFFYFLNLFFGFGTVGGWFGFAWIDKFYPFVVFPGEVVVVRCYCCEVGFGVQGTGSSIGRLALAILLCRAFWWIECAG